MKRDLSLTLWRALALINTHVCRPTADNCLSNVLFGKVGIFEGDPVSTASIASVARAPTVVVPKASPVPTKSADTQPAAAPQAAQSSAAALVNAATAALKEAAETSVQTAKEAAKGDRQAQRLLARESEAVQARSAAPSNGKGTQINVKA